MPGDEWKNFHKYERPPLPRTNKLTLDLHLPVLNGMLSEPFTNHIFQKSPIHYDFS